MKKENKNSVKLDNNPMPYFIGSLILIFSIIFVFYLWNGKSLKPQSEPTPTPNPQPEISASVTDLQAHTWNWNRSEYKDEVAIIKNGENYQLTFNTDGTFNARIDCNSGSGTYVADDTGSIKMTLGPVTEAFCGETSSDQEFITVINAVQDYRTHDGQLLQLNMPADGPKEFFIPDSQGIPASSNGNSN